MTVPSSASVFTGKPSPQQTLAIARGLLAESFPIACVTTSRTLPSQTVLGVLIPVSFGSTISGVAVCVETAAAGTVPTSVTLGIYDLVSNRLAVSADVKADFASSTGLQSFPFATAWTVTADGCVVACVLKNGTYGSTEPKLVCAPTVVGMGGHLGGNFGSGVTITGQTSLPSLTSFNDSDSLVWMGLV